MPATQPPPRPLRLALLLYPGCMPAGLFAAADMARAANLRAQTRLIETCWVAADLQPVPTWQGPALAPTVTLAQAEADAVLVPGLWLSSPDDLQTPLQSLAPAVQALRELPRRTAVWSYCAGVLLSAASGRLNGQPATATWWLRAALSQRFDQVHWRFDEPLVAGTSTITAAGANGHLPLMLHALANRMPAEALNDLQDVLMLPRPRRNPPALAGDDLMSMRNAELRKALLWVQRSPATELRLPALAAALGVSQRTLSRRVQAHTGLPAAQWMRRIKLQQVGNALLETPWPLKRIAADLGFASEAGLHRAFRQATGQTPQDWRIANSRR